MANPLKDLLKGKDDDANTPGFDLIVRMTIDGYEIYLNGKNYAKLSDMDLIFEEFAIWRQSCSHVRRLETTFANNARKVKNSDVKNNVRDLYSPLNCSILGRFGRTEKYHCGQRRSVQRI